MVVSTVMLLSDAAHAMEIRQFDKMANQDQSEYIGEKVLTDEGRADKPMITDNPDGTFTIQKEPPNPNSKDAKANGGLVIPPQVVVPFVRLPKKKQSPTPQQTNR